MNNYWPKVDVEQALALIWDMCRCQCRSPVIPCPVHPEAVKGTPIPGLEDLREAPEA